MSEWVGGYLWLPELKEPVEGGLIEVVGLAEPAFLSY